MSKLSTISKLSSNVKIATQFRLCRSRSFNIYACALSKLAQSKRHYTQRWNKNKLMQDQKFQSTLFPARFQLTCQWHLDKRKSPLQSVVSWYRKQTTIIAPWGWLLLAFYHLHGITCSLAINKARYLCNSGLSMMHAIIKIDHVVSRASNCKTHNQWFPVCNIWIPADGITCHHPMRKLFLSSVWEPFLCMNALLFSWSRCKPGYHTRRSVVEFMIHPFCFSFCFPSTSSSFSIIMFTIFY